MSNYDAMLSNLFRIAQSRTGAAVVLNAGLFSAIRDAGLFSADPDIGLGECHQQLSYHKYKLLI